MKPRLTFAEHVELGAVLAGIYSELLARSVQVYNAYPHASPQARHLDAAVRTMEAARHHLDNALAHEYEDEFDPAVYYPGDGYRAQVVLP